MSKIPIFVQIQIPTMSRSFELVNLVLAISHLSALPYFKVRDYIVAIGHLNSWSAGSLRIRKFESSNRLDEHQEL